jgi:hypothetical protein
MESIAQCFAIVRHIDVGISISMTQEEREDSRGRFFVFASRNEAGGQVIPFSCDLGRSIFRTEDPRRTTESERSRNMDDGKPKRKGKKKDADEDADDAETKKKLDKAMERKKVKGGDCAY